MTKTISKIENDWIVKVADDFSKELLELIYNFQDQFSGWVESPIELKFLTAFWALTRLRSIECWLCHPYPTTTPVMFKNSCREYDMVIVPQYPWKKYRTDFCLGGRSVGTLILIECDGHDFHDRTKEQAIWDRERDANAQKDGFSILRFTGSQLTRDPLYCADATLDFAKAMKSQRHSS